MLEQAIKRFESLDPETERRCLESFLYALTNVARYLLAKHADSEARLRILIQVNEINHHALNRFKALSGENSFFTVAYTLHAVEEHASHEPELEELVMGLFDNVLKKAGT